MNDKQKPNPKSEQNTRHIGRIVDKNGDVHYTSIYVGSNSYYAMPTVVGKLAAKLLKEGLLTQERYEYILHYIK